MRDKSYFISDIHLGARCISDPKAHECTIVRWLESIESDALNLYLLGDILDYWYEYREVVPRGFVRFFGALARLADRGVNIVWFKGNHDIWIFDYIPTEIGVTVVDGAFDTVIDGKRFFMEHGDGVGETRASYRRMRAIFRNRTCQKIFSAIHPRWTVPFAHKWSSHSRATTTDTLINLPDDHKLVTFAKNYEQTHPHVDYFVFGHLHIPVKREILPNSQLIVLGDAFTNMTYGYFDGKDFFIDKIEAKIAN
ncbi:MAG: UDP-2,3-diacylglucosamine diphosphatase [Paramuribaculum sp.]|nr:UDP-2,3-diacylglucosamine diphosphatase [Paramuribaculum sp.]